jgi:flavin reductase (DIM6/NTAB) family NADH-FMN oxidoreductase RutF/pimeloyl-ACP methyl ester carboxylesterase
MPVHDFTGFAGITLKADVLGSPDDPSVLLVHSGCQTRKSWSAAANALVKAGRYVINLDLRGHGESEWPPDKRYEFNAFVEDLRSVLAQLASRPVIVAAPLGGWAATVVMGENSAPLASGLVLADAPPVVDNDVARDFRAGLKRAAEEDPNVSWDPVFLDAFDTPNVFLRLASAAKNIKAPTLFVRGNRSDQTTPEMVGEFIKLLPNAEAIEIDDAGHFVAYERSDLFNAVLLDFLERTDPRAAPEYVVGSDPRTLRDAMGCFSTGITVVTALSGNGRPVGLTANSFTSVSLDPPLVLACIARSARSLSVFESTSHFGINILHIGQQPISNLFSSRVEDRFSQIDWEPGQNGVPVLTKSLASIECARHAVYDGGDHIILVGRVERARFESRRDPLLYFSGKYRRLHLG